MGAVVKAHHILSERNSPLHNSFLITNDLVLSLPCNALNYFPIRVIPLSESGICQRRKFWSYSPK